MFIHTRKKIRIFRSDIMQSDSSRVTKEQKYCDHTLKINIISLPNKNPALSIIFYPFKNSVLQQRYCQTLYPIKPSLIIQGANIFSVMYPREPGKKTASTCGIRMSYIIIFFLQMKTTAKRTIRFYCVYGNIGPYKGCLR